MISHTTLGHLSLTTKMTQCIIGSSEEKETMCEWEIKQNENMPQFGQVVMKVMQRTLDWHSLGEN